MCGSHLGGIQMIFNVGAGGAGKAESVKYNNAESGLVSDNVQGAVDELNNSISEVNEAVSEVNNNLGGLRFGVDGEGNYGYLKGDDTFVPFKGSATLERIIVESPNSSTLVTYNKTFTCSHDSRVYIYVENDQSFGSRPITVKHNGVTIATSTSVETYIDVLNGDTINVTFNYGRATVLLLYVD